MRDRVSPLHPTPNPFEHLLCETLQRDVWPDGRGGEEAQHLKAQVWGQMALSSNPTSLLGLSLSQHPQGDLSVGDRDVLLPGRDSPWYTSRGMEQTGLGMGLVWTLRAGWIQALWLEY